MNISWRIMLNPICNKIIIGIVRLSRGRLVIRLLKDGKPIGEEGKC
jgi:hypothetical protein